MALANVNRPAGAGLGLRRALLGPLESAPEGALDFFELAPENWIGVGGRLGKRLRALTERHAFVAHGLSLSLGGPSALDETFLARVRRFLDLHRIGVYSEHLSACTDDAHLYDLMPVPFTADAVRHCATRIARTQDILGRRIAVENVSYYTSLGGELSELQFINAVLAEADCELLLDVNNIHVNSVNHGYEPLAFLRGLPHDRVRYLHIAGHFREAPDLLIDTHGAEVIDPVFELLASAYDHVGPLPTLLERDFNFPPVEDLYAELAHVRMLQAAARVEPRNAASG